MTCSSPRSAAQCPDRLPAGAGTAEHGRSSAAGRSIPVPVPAPPVRFLSIRLRTARTEVRLRPIDPWVKAFGVQISLFDPWVKAFEVRISLFDPWVKAFEVRISLFDPWVKAFEVRISLFDPWVKAFEVRISLFDPWVTRVQDAAPQPVPVCSRRAQCISSSVPATIVSAVTGTPMRR